MKFERTLKNDDYKFILEGSQKIKYLMALVKGINKAQDVQLTHESKLFLLAEPENKFDKNAVKVTTDTLLFTGYLEKDVAAIISPLLPSGSIKCQILGPSKECPTWYEILISHGA